MDRCEPKLRSKDQGRNVLSSAVPRAAFSFYLCSANDGNSYGNAVEKRRKNGEKKMKSRPNVSIAVGFKEGPRRVQSEKCGRLR